MRCTHCYNELQQEGRYCIHCGSKVGQEAGVSVERTLHPIRRWAPQAESAKKTAKTKPKGRRSAIVLSFLFFTCCTLLACLDPTYSERKFELITLVLFYIVPQTLYGIVAAIIASTQPRLAGWLLMLPMTFTIFWLIITMQASGPIFLIFVALAAIYLITAIRMWLGCRNRKTP